MQGEPISEAPKSEPDPVREVFAHWLRAYRHRHPKANERKPDAKERQAIRNALDLGYTPAELKVAIEGLFLSPWHLGANDRRKEYLRIGLAFETSNLEQFREAATKRREAREAARKRAETPLAPQVDADSARSRRDALAGQFQLPAVPLSSEPPNEPDTEEPLLAAGGVT